MLFEILHARFMCLKSPCKLVMILRISSDPVHPKLIPVCLLQLGSHNETVMSFQGNEALFIFYHVIKDKTNKQPRRGLHLDTPLNKHRPQGFNITARRFTCLPTLRCFDPAPQLPTVQTLTFIYQVSLRDSTLLMWMNKLDLSCVCLCVLIVTAITKLASMSSPCGLNMFTLELTWRQERKQKPTNGAASKSPETNGWP